MNASVNLKVQIATDQAVVIRVYQEGQPHPKGFRAEVDHTVGPMVVQPEMMERAKDAAINHARGQAHEFSISEFFADQAEAKDANGTVYEECTTDECKTAETGNATPATQNAEDKDGPGSAAS